MSPSSVYISIIGLRHPHATPGHEPVSWLDTIQQCPDMRIRAVFESHPDGQKLARRHLPDVPLYDDLDAMFAANRDIKAALVLMPNNESAQYVSLLTQKGIHFAVDKPGAKTAEELKLLIAPIKVNNIITAVGYLRRYDPMVKEIQRMLDEQRFGPLWLMETAFFTTQVRDRGIDSPVFSKEISGGGILHWLGCHMMDLIFYLSRSYPTEILSTMANLGRESIDVEDTALVSMKLQSGVLATLATGYLRPTGNEVTLTMHCQEATVKADFIKRCMEIVERNGVSSTVQFPDQKSLHPCYGGKGGVDFLQSFADHVRHREGHAMESNQEDVPFATLDEAVNVLEALEAAYHGSR